MQAELGLTYIFISHSLPVVAQLASHIAVMRAGQFVEIVPAEMILTTPKMIYTLELLGAVPQLSQPSVV